jgi:membrane-associated phospholipid phosphatase
MKIMFLFELINYIGYYGPIILLISTIILLFNTKIFLYTYFLGFVINSIFNFIIKGVIKQKRPLNDVKSKIIKESRLGNEIYGMPSGHSQSVMFSTLFVFRALKNDLITFIYLIISGATMWQREYNYSHSLLQILIGGTLGSIFGYYAYKYAKKINKKMKKNKKKNEKNKIQKESYKEIYGKNDDSNNDDSNSDVSDD